jgi:hypothetical protein
MKATHISKTAIVLQNGPTAGGAFTYEGNVLASLSKLPNHSEFIVLCPPSTTESVQESFPMFTVVPYTCGLVAKFLLQFADHCLGTTYSNQSACDMENLRNPYAVMELAWHTFCPQTQFH